MNVNKFILNRLGLEGRFFIGMIGVDLWLYIKLPIN